MALKDAYQERIEAQIKEWDADFSKWKAKAEIANADARIEYYKKLEGIRPQIDQAKVKLSLLKATSEEAWEEMKTGIDKACSDLSLAFIDLRKTVDHAIGKFQS